MGEPKFDTGDFDFSFNIHEDEGVAIIDHFNVDEDIRRNGYGSVILETLKRVAFQNDSVTKLEVSIGGGHKTEQFLESNGFRVFDRREYSEVTKEHVEGDFGVDAEYLEEWVSEDYQPL